MTLQLKHIFTWATVLCVLAAAPVWSQENKEPSNSEKAVRKFIDGKGAHGAGEITSKNEDTVRKTFPGHDLVIARFRQFPVARILPEGLSPSSLFAVDKSGQVDHLADAKALEKFFRAHHPAVKGEKDAKTLLAAWLALTQEFHQDGMFKFEVMEKEASFADGKITGRATVVQGGNGQITVTLSLDKEGKLAGVEEKAELREGPRPICQATKLLDADPLVRRICERDLLIMGLSARDYLMEQREGAAPGLQAEIDRLWRQIQKNGW